MKAWTVHAPAGDPWTARHSRRTVLERRKPLARITRESSTATPEMRANTALRLLSLLDILHRVCLRRESSARLVSRASPTSRHEFRG